MTHGSEQRTCYDELRYAPRLGNETKDGAFLTIDWLVTLVLWQRITRPASIRHVQPQPLTPQLWRHYTYEFFFFIVFTGFFYIRRSPNRHRCHGHKGDTHEGTSVG